MEEISTQVSPLIMLQEEIETESGQSYKCDLCGKILSSNKNLKKHLKLHTSSRDYVCKLCDKSYKRSDHLRRHMITHEPNPNYYECEYCYKRFNLHYHLTSHIQNVHTEPKIKLYKCPDCELYFNKKSKLFLHQKDFHHLNLEKIPCYYPYCKKSYISEQKLNDHIKKYHMNVINNNQNWSLFNENMDEVDNEYQLESNEPEDEKKFFKCPYKECLKVYSSQYNLSVHIKTNHLKIKSFKCNLCSNKYYHKVSLKKHLMIEHKYNKEQLTQYFEETKNVSSDNKEEVINEVKKNFENEGLCSGEEAEGVGELELSIKSSESFNERKNGELFLNEFQNNMINENKLNNQTLEEAI